MGIPSSSVEGGVRDPAVQAASAEGETRESADAARAQRLFSRTGVSDAVMLQNQPENGYRDTPVP
jgi:hypothetical protein